MDNHQNIVEQVRNAQPSETWKTTPEGILSVLLKVIGALPRDERGGLLRKDVGENITWYAPRNCNVSISRVCYPDGKIWKVFTDAGPGGANGAGWGDDGYVEVSRYLEIVSTQPIPGPTPPAPTPIDLTPRVTTLETTLAGLVIIVQDAINRFEAGIKELEDAPPPTFELPPLIAEGNTNRVWGHAHEIHLEVRKK